MRLVIGHINMCSITCHPCIPPLSHVSVTGKVAMGSVLTVHRCWALVLVLVEDEIKDQLVFQIVLAKILFFLFRINRWLLTKQNGRYLFQEHYLLAFEKNHIGGTQKYCCRWRIYMWNASWKDRKRRREQIFTSVALTVMLLSIGGLLSISTMTYGSRKWSSVRGSVSQGMSSNSS